MYKKSNKNVNIETAYEDLKDVLNEFLPGFVKNDFKIQKMEGGASNVLFVVYNGEKIIPCVTDAYLCRVYGDIPLDRDSETINMVNLSKFDLAAEVLGQFGNGVCYRYLHGSTLEVEDIAHESIYPLIIKELSCLHSIEITGDVDKRPFMINKIREFTARMPDNFENPETNQKYHAVIPSKPKILEYLDIIEKKLEHLSPRVSFTHNDLLVRNFILNYEKDRIRFIDFEYGGYNYCAFDIANHFNEFAGFDDPDYSLFPNKSFRRSWIQQYLKESGLDSSPEQLSHWEKCVDLCLLLSHILWGVWAIWQEWRSDINFGYLDYAMKRWIQFNKIQNDILGD